MDDNDPLGNDNGQFVRMTQAWVAKHLESDLIDTTISAEDVKEIETFLEADPKRYQLENVDLMLYMATLFDPDANPFHWHFGYSLVKQFAKHRHRQSRKRGRPTTLPQRIYICAFIEWCFELKGNSYDHAIQTAAALFEVPIDRLNKWYKGDKGVATREIKAAREAISLTEQWRQGIKTEFEAASKDPKHFSDYISPRNPN